MPQINKYLGPLGNEDILPDTVMNKSFGATPQGTATIAKNIGASPSKDLAAGRILQKIGENKAAPETIPNKLGWKSPDTQAQFKSLLPPDKFGKLKDTMDTLERVRIGMSKTPESGAPTAARLQSEANLETMANPKSWPYKAVKYLYDSMTGRSSAQYLKDRANALLSDEGQKLVQRLATATTRGEKAKTWFDFNKFLASAQASQDKTK